MKDVKSPTKKFKSHKNLQKYNKKEENFQRSINSLGYEKTYRKMKSQHHLETKKKWKYNNTSYKRKKQ